MSKTNKTKAEVFHFDLYGKRDEKYNFLNDNSIGNIEWNELKPNEPNFFLVKKNFNSTSEYMNWIELGELFKINITGIKTHDDKNLVSFERFNENNCQYDYRPFDLRFINYDLKKVVRHRFAVMRHMLHDNLSLIIPRQAVTNNWNHVQVSKHLSDNRIHYSNKGIPIVCPLYLYADSNIEQRTERTPNLNMEIVQKIADKLSLTFTNEPFDYAQGATRATFAPIDILDYIYAVLHSPTYREKYKEFLKIDFPRVPYPKDTATFWQLVKFGGELRQIHLLESPIVENYITQYPIDGNNVVGKIRFDFAQHEKNGKVYINETQYFANVPEVAWSFFIGGYQPAQKWLKDRKGCTLEFDDILHYQKIIVALSETSRLMAEINRIEIE
jgi:predicted helicase